MTTYYSGNWKSTIIPSVFGRCYVKITGDKADFMLVYDGTFMCGLQRVISDMQISNELDASCNAPIVMFKHRLNQQFELKANTYNKNYINGIYTTYNPNDNGVFEMNEDANVSLLTFVD